MGLAGCGMEQAGSSVADAGLVACAAPLHRDMAVVAREAVWADAAGTIAFPMGGIPGLGSSGALPAEGAPAQGRRHGRCRLYPWRRGFPGDKNWSNREGIPE